MRCDDSPARVTTFLWLAATCKQGDQESGESNIRTEARESGNNSVQVWRSAECSNTNTELLDRILLPKPQEKGEIREKLGRNQAEATRADNGLYQEVGAR